MKHLKTFNESIFGDISRSVVPGRYESDVKANEIIREIIKDFNENGKDLK